MKMPTITDRRDTDTDREMATRIREGLLNHRWECGLTNAEMYIEVTVGNVTITEGFDPDSGNALIRIDPHPAMEIRLWDRKLPPWQGNRVREIPLSFEGYVEALNRIVGIAMRKLEA